MSRKKLLLNLFISKNPKFLIFYNFFDGYRNYIVFFDFYILNNESVNYEKFLLGTMSVSKDKLEKVFFVVSVKYK